MALTVKQHAKVAAWAVVAAGVALAPIGVSAAANNASTTIQATVVDAISVTSGPTVSFSLTPTTGGAVSSASDTVTVATNKSNGYTLTMKNADATSNLVSGGNNFLPHAGTFAAPTALAANTWGYAVAGGAFDASYSAESSAGASATKWAGVPVSSGTAATLKTTAAPSGGDATTVWYAAKANMTQPSGTYSDVVTYTATTN